MRSRMVSQKWMYQLPYLKCLQSPIRSEEVTTSLSLMSFSVLLTKPGINRHSVFVILGMIRKPALVFFLWSSLTFFSVL